MFKEMGESVGNVIDKGLIITAVGLSSYGIYRLVQSHQSNDDKKDDTSENLEVANKEKGK